MSNEFKVGAKVVVADSTSVFDLKEGRVVEVNGNSSFKYLVKLDRSGATFGFHQEELQPTV